MSAAFLDMLSISDYSHLIPEELLEGARNGEFLSIGGTFMDEPVGAMVCEKLRGDGMLIRSIFVEEPYRRLGVASEMMELIAGKKLSFSYEATGDRAALEPFFDAMDIDTLRLDLPMAYLSIEEIDKRLTGAGAYKVPECGRTFSDMSPDERKVVMKWIEGTLNERGEAYDWVHPDSMFLVADKKVIACVLLSEMEDELLSVDLVFCDPGCDPKKLMGLFARLMLNVLEDYDKVTGVRMIMTTEEGRRLYEKLFKAPVFSVPLIMAA